MVMLSTHFDLIEFEKDGPVTGSAIQSFSKLCNAILEPVRVKFGPLVITSGYRSPEANEEAHGQPNSEHVATADYCAADFYCPTSNSRPIFDWMRENPNLPYHQLILENGKTMTIVHVSYNRLKPGVRSVLIGATHNSEPYVAAEHVDFMER